MKGIIFFLHEMQTIIPAYYYSWINYIFTVARQWGNALHSVGMKCSSRHTLAPIDSIFGGQLPPIIPQGARLVEAHSLQSQRGPNSLLSTQECSQWP